MQQAIILINVRRGGVDHVAQQLLRIDGVTEVYSTAGSWDMVALVRVADPEKLNSVVNRDMAEVDGIERTYTLTAFRCYSQDDLGRMFSVGLAEDGQSA